MSGMKLTSYDTTNKYETIILMSRFRNLLKLENLNNFIVYARKNAIFCSMREEINEMEIRARAHIQTHTRIHICVTLVYIHINKNLYINVFFSIKSNINHTDVYTFSTHRLSRQLSLCKTIFFNCL